MRMRCRRSGKKLEDNGIRRDDPIALALARDIYILLRYPIRRL